jgi:nucleotide-binding universal stress UspA family protein
MASSKPTILVPVDFSEQSLIALSQSYNLAREYKADLTLLYIIEDSGIISKLFSKKQHKELQKKMTDDLKKLARETEKKSRIKVNILIERGNVYDNIIEAGEKINALFIIMGTDGGDKGIKNRFIGSNALRVVRSSKIPVITIGGKKHRNGCKNIVLPLDLSKETKQKVNKAIEIANLGSGAAIRVVSIIMTKDEFIVNRLTRQLGQVKHFIEKAGVECTAEIIKIVQGDDSLAKCILDYAQKVDADLIMIMTQQEIDFTQYFIGSSAQEIINTSTIPVISIIPHLKEVATFTGNM